jgi:hypothetical protein
MIGFMCIYQIDMCTYQLPIYISGRGGNGVPRPRPKPNKNPR